MYKANSYQNETQWSNYILSFSYGSFQNCGFDCHWALEKSILSALWNDLLIIVQKKAKLSHQANFDENTPQCSGSFVTSVGQVNTIRWKMTTQGVRGKSSSHLLWWTTTLVLAISCLGKTNLDFYTILLDLFFRGYWPTVFHH